MQPTYTTSKPSGFTLIEVLLIAPIIILLIGVFVALIVNLTGESLVLREKNNTIYDIHNALDDMEQTANSSASFVGSTPGMPIPQGKNNTGTQFNAKTVGAADALIIISPSTTENSYSPNRSLISLDAGACDASKTLHYYYSIYFVSSGALTKRTVVPSGPPNDNLCATPWQHNSCAVANMSSPRCAAEDEILVEGLANTEAAFAVSYFQQDGTTPAQPSLAKKATVSLSASRQISGETADASGSLQITRISPRPFSASEVINPF